MIVPRPVEVESTDANLLAIQKIKLPVITYMDKLAGVNIHRLTYLQVEAGGLQLPVM